MTWTTEQPTMTGYYWLRNARTRFGVYSEPQIVEIVIFMEGDEGDAPTLGPMRVLLFGFFYFAAASLGYLRRMVRPDRGAA